MPRYYCDYCDKYLPHDSPFGRKQHNQGYKHKENVRKYYQQFEEQQTQSLINQKIKEHLSGQAAFNQMSAYYAACPPSASPPVFPPPMAPAYGTPAQAPVYRGVSAATMQTNVPPEQPVVGPATYALGTTPNAAAVYAPQPMFQDMPRIRKL